MLAPFLITALIEPVFLLVLMGLSAQMLAYLSPAASSLSSYYYGDGLGSGGFGSSGSGDSDDNIGGGGYNGPAYTEILRSMSSMRGIATTSMAVSSSFDFGSAFGGGGYTLHSDGGGVLGPGAFSAFDDLDSALSAFSITTRGLPVANLPRAIATGTNTPIAPREYVYMPDGLYARQSNEQQGEKRFAQPTPTGLVSRDDSADKEKLAKRSPSPTQVPDPSIARKRGHLEKRVSLPTSASELTSILRACLAFYALLFVAVWIRLIMLAVYLVLTLTRRKRDHDEYGQVSRAHSSTTTEPLSVDLNRYGSSQTRRLLRSFFVASCAMTAIIFVFGIVVFALQGARLGLGGVSAAAVAFWVFSVIMCALTTFFLRRHLSSLQGLRDDEYAKSASYPQQATYAQPGQTREMQETQPATHQQPSVAPQQAQPPVQAAVPPPAQESEQAPAAAPNQVGTQASEQAPAPGITGSTPI